MDKKKEVDKASKKEKEESPKEERSETGFPEDIDFKKFLGCGG